MSIDEREAQAVSEREVSTSKLDARNAVDRALMIAARMQEVWRLDLRTTQGYERLTQLRQEVNYLTTEKRASPESIPRAELPLGVFDYDNSNVVHRVSHPDRSGDEVNSVDSKLRAEIVTLLEADPYIMKMLASRDILLTDQ